MKGKVCDQVLVVCLVTPGMLCAPFHDILDSFLRGAQEEVAPGLVYYLKNNSSLPTESGPVALFHTFR